MLLHLPIAILATLSPIPVSNTVPTFDMVKECRFEAGSVVDFDHCSRDETLALRQLLQAWTNFAGVDQKTCMGETTISGFASYVELLTCLEMARDAASTNTNPQDPRTRSGPALTRPGRTGVTVGEAHQH